MYEFFTVYMYIGAFVCLLFTVGTLVAVHMKGGLKPYAEAVSRTGDLHGGNVRFYIFVSAMACFLLWPCALYLWVKKKQ